jgi:hypothetical protein
MPPKTQTPAPIQKIIESAIHTAKVETEQPIKTSITATQAATELP